MTTHICGIDIGNTVFHLVGLSKEGHIIVKKRFNRKQLLTYTVNLPACLIGVEACAVAHFAGKTAESNYKELPSAHRPAR